MKKLVVFFGIIVLLSQGVFAQDQLGLNDAISMTSTGNNTWYMADGIEPIGNLEIKGVSDFVGNTFSISVPHDFPIIFVDNESVTINGESQSVTYSQGRTDLYFEASSGDMIIEGIQVKVYDIESLSRDHFLLDVDGDRVFDARDTNEIEVDDNDDRNEDDDLRPEIIPGIETELVENGVKVTWMDPVDLDVRDIFVQRTLNGQYKELFWNQLDLEYIDTDVQTGDNVTYVLQARDVYFLGEPTTITLENIELPVMEEEVAPEEEVNEEPQEETSETEEEENQDYSRSELLDMAADAMSREKIPVERLQTIRTQLKAFDNVIHRLIFMRRVVEISEERKNN